MDTRQRWTVARSLAYQIASCRHDLLANHQSDGSSLAGNMYVSACGTREWIVTGDAQQVLGRSLLGHPGDVLVAVSCRPLTCQLLLADGKLVRCRVRHTPRAAHGGGS